MELAKLIILLTYLAIIVIVIAFNWLYAARTIRATKQIGLYVPSYIKQLVRVSNALAMITAVVIGIVLLFGIY